jgi:hypothetical protein
MPDISIANINANDANAKQFRRMQEFGLHVSDFLAISGTRAYDGFGSGVVYTVENWISSGAFANLAAVQAVYPIVQDTSDYVDWVIIQSAIDFAIYGSLGNSNRAGMKRIVRLPAGNFNINRTLHIGYSLYGTPPADLNANGYVSVTIEGEGPQYDSSGNGMPGTTITTSGTSFIGIAITRGVDVILRDFTLQGNYDSYLASNNPYKSDIGWDVEAWRRVSPAVTDANWIDGDALNVGVCLSPYTEATSAAAYPARVLPSYFGGGTASGTSGTAGGSGLTLDKVDIRGFIVGLGRPYGDQNDEFINYRGGTISNCVYGVVIRHSQNRNISFRDCRFEGCHTALVNRGGANLSGNSNMHGCYDNIHFGRCYQLFSHDNGDWSGPILLRSCYAESFMSIGKCDLSVMKLDNCQMSFVEQEVNCGVAPYHFKGSKIIVDNTYLGISRHGFIVGDGGLHNQTQVILSNGSFIDSHVLTRGNSSGTTFNGHPNLTQIISGFNYMRGVLSLPSRTTQIANNSLISEYGPNTVDVNRTDKVIDTYSSQEWTQFYSVHPYTQYPNLRGSNEMQGSVQSFRVPKVSVKEFGGFNVASRLGLNVVCNRFAFGDIKMDVGDIIATYPETPDAAMKTTNWFIVSSITGGGTTVTMTQLNNFYSTTGTNYFTNGWNQVNVGTGMGYTCWICTRIKQNHRLFVGDVTSGSNVITNIRHAFTYGAADDFISDNFGMQVGDIFLHQEIERANTGGSGLKVTNPVTAIDFTANTITLTNNFNITRTNYPIVFFIDVHNA